MPPNLGIKLISSFAMSEPEFLEKAFARRDNAITAFLMS